MAIFRKILFPFTLLYFLISQTRNFLFDINLLKTKHFSIPLIGVGNLSSGGTGKTPLVEYILRNFCKDFNMSLLSRGYKRHGSGYVKADNNSTPSSIGDEPYQIFNKFKNIDLAVDENRVRGIENLTKENPYLHSVILDDCFQHRYVSCELNILLSTYSNPFFKDYLLPMGNLRESRNGYKRANVIIVTKCPNDLNSKEINTFSNFIKLKNNQSLFFTTIAYNSTLKGGGSNIQIEKLKDFKVLLVTGIADYSPLLKYLNNKNINFDHLIFSDHHNYSSTDIETIEKKYTDRIVLTTEKDFKKINDLDLKNQLYYLEIEIKFLNKGEESFKKIIKKLIIS
tara:strand:+ start:2288 stop:3307 length:1020 start_codon:yes stop_codon:yes gene_type:complete